MPLHGQKLPWLEAICGMDLRVQLMLRELGVSERDASLFKLCRFEYIKHI